MSGVAGVLARATARSLLRFRGRCPVPALVPPPGLALAREVSVKDDAARPRGASDLRASRLARAARGRSLVPLQLPLERGEPDPEGRRGAGPVAAGALHRGEDVLALDVLQRPRLARRSEAAAWRSAAPRGDPRPRRGFRRRAPPRARSRSAPPGRCPATRTRRSWSAARGVKPVILRPIRRAVSTRNTRASGRTSSGTLAQRRYPQLDHAEPVVEVLAEPPRRHVAAEVRGWSRPRCARPPRRDLFSPTRRISFSWSTRRSFTCIPGGISPTSSRNSVPPFAASKRPAAVAVGAGEGAARVAEELALEQGLGQRRRSSPPRTGRVARGDSSWMSRAIRSLPTPLSPVMSAVGARPRPRAAPG